MIFNVKSLNKQTRVFVTNSLSFLPQVDEIIMLENGMVAEMGTYDELKTRGGVFADFIRLCLVDENKSDLG
jgi:ABC-type bacteriocin/lantibiotic exporter with double-glycine peptidase domain